MSKVRANQEMNEVRRRVPASRGANPAVRRAALACLLVATLALNA